MGARGGGGGEHDARHGRDWTPARKWQDIKTNLGVEELVSNVTCVECAPPRGFELSFREILIFRLRVCAAVVAVSDLCRIYRSAQERATRSCTSRSSCRGIARPPASARALRLRSAFRVRHGSIAAPAGGCWVQASTRLPRTNYNTVDASTVAGPAAWQCVALAPWRTGGRPRAGSPVCVI